MEVVAVSSEVNLVDSIPDTSDYSDDFEVTSTLTTYSINENVLHIPVLGGLKRDSCEWTNTNQPCINKISSHLSKLERALAGIERATKVVPNLNDFTTDAHRIEIIIGPTPGEGDVKPTGITTYTMGMEIIDEVRDLIERMKKDRQQTIDALMRERERVKLLQLQVDKVERKRHRVIPRAVQLEHEACHQDLAELKWILEFESIEREEMEVKVAAARKNNKELQDTILRLTEQCPNIKEKVEMDKLTMAEIALKLQEAKAAFEYTDGIYRKAYGRFERATAKATTERRQMKRDLDDTKNTLLQLKQDIEDEKEREIKRKEKQKVLRGSIVEERDKSKDLDVKLDEVRDRFKEISEKVHNSKVKLLELAQSIKAYRRCNLRASTRYEAKKKILEVAEKNRTKMLIFRRNMLKESLQLIIQMERDIIEFKKELTVAIKKARDDEKATVRAEAELKRLDTQLRVVVEEVLKLKQRNDVMVIEYERLDEQITHAESLMKNNFAIFNKTLEDVVRTKSILANKIITDTQDFEDFKDLSSRKIDKITVKKNDVEAIHKKLDKRKDSLQKKLNVINGHKAELDKIAVERREHLVREKQRLKEKMNESKNEAKRIKDEIAKTEEENRNIKWRVEMMKNKIKESEDSVRIVSKLRAQAEADIVIMEESSDELGSELKDEQDIDDSLMRTIGFLNNNMISSRNAHKALIEERNIFFQNIKKEVQQYIDFNNRLSVNYKDLQDHHALSKRAYQKALANKLELEANLLEIYKFCALQSAMRAVLISYYTQRGHHNREVLYNFAKGCLGNLDNFGGVHLNMEHLVSVTERYLDRFSSGVAPKQPRISSPHIAKVLEDHDSKHLPIFIEARKIPPIDGSNRQNLTFTGSNKQEHSTTISNQRESTASGSTQKEPTVSSEKEPISGSSNRERPITSPSNQKDTIAASLNQKEVQPTAPPSYRKDSSRPGPSHVDSYNICVEGGDDISID